MSEGKPIKTAVGQSHVWKRNGNIPVRVGYRVNRARFRHGAMSLLRAYTCGALDRRSAEGRLVSLREGQYARHLGFTAFKVCPVTLQGKIHLVIRLELFLATVEPDPNSKTGYRDVRSAENSLSRLYSELGLKPAEKSIDLAVAFASLER